MNPSAESPGALSKFGRFLLVGGANTALSYALYLALSPWLGYRWAYVVAFVAGVSLSYVLSTRWVFDSVGGVRQALAFPLVYAPQLLLGSAVLAFAVETIGIHPDLALLLVIALTVPVNFLLARFMLQKRSTSENR